MIKIKSLIFLLFALISWKVSSVLAQEENVVSVDEAGYEKAFTAACDVTTVNSFDGNLFCVYSVIFITFTSILSGTTIISVNGQETVYTFTITSTQNFVANFNVQKNDQVLIRFNPSMQLVQTSNYYFKVQNEPNQPGVVAASTPLQGDTIITSRARIFEVLNKCDSECTYRISSSNSFTMWFALRTTVGIFINGFELSTRFNGNLYDYNIKKGDVITYQVYSPVPGSGLQLTTTDKNVPSRIILIWYLELFFSPMIVPNSCTKTSPFGGSVVLMSSEEVQIFLNSISAPISSYWFPKIEKNIANDE